MDNELVKRNLVVAIVDHLNRACNVNPNDIKLCELNGEIQGKFSEFDYDVRCLYGEKAFDYFLHMICTFGDWEMTKEITKELATWGVEIKVVSFDDFYSSIKYNCVIDKVTLSKRAEEFNRISRLSWKITRVIKGCIIEVARDDKYLGLQCKMGDEHMFFDTNCTVTRGVCFMDKAGNVLYRLRFTADKFTQPSYVEL